MTELEIYLNRNSLLVSGKNHERNCREKKGFSTNQNFKKDTDIHNYQSSFFDSKENVLFEFYGAIITINYKQQM